MAAFVVMIAASLAASTGIAEPVPERIQRHFRSDDYTVTWGAATRYEPDADLEIGDGEGHGGMLRWLRFRPTHESVDVLSIELDEGSGSYNSKWPPDRVQATVRHARMRRDAYASLVEDLGVVNAAEVRLIQREGWPLRSWVGSNNSWAYARLAAKNKTVLRLDWAGNFSSLSAADSAKPLAAVGLAQDAIEGLEFKAYVLSKEDRVWASEKFARDWRKFERCESHWWVREAHIELVGIIGDESALPTLRRILEGHPKDRFGDESDDRCTYCAINAVTRLVKKDVRDKPVEEMDLENTRRKVLDLLGVEVGKKPSPETKDTPKSGSRGGCPPKPPHHLACGSALGGSAKRSKCNPALL
ncbi:MAG: hypothetical protein H8E44_39490 [Planctomycetes bacterium]|nr:hypothetical protein [Planctomycetota bacterium]MBL7040974.1 hypothetical protein [Pirellulaceae bacterium]